MFASRKWRELNLLLQRIIFNEDGLEESKRNYSRLAMALFWRARYNLSTGDIAAAKNSLERLVNEGFSSFYGAMGHFLLESLGDQSIPLFPQRRRLNLQTQIMNNLSSAEKNLVERVVLLSSLGLDRDALCSLEEFEYRLYSGYRSFGHLMMVLKSGSVLDQVRGFVRLSRAFRKSLSFGFERGLFPRLYGDIIDEQSANFGIDPDIIASVIRQESAFNADAVSRAGAQGLMQIMPRTAVYQRDVIFTKYPQPLSKHFIDILARLDSRNSNIFSPRENIFLAPVT